MKTSKILIVVSIVVVLIVAGIWFYIYNKNKKLAEAKRIFVLYANANKNAYNTKMAEYEKQIKDLGYIVNSNSLNNRIELIDSNYNLIMYLPG